MNDPDELPSFTRRCATCVTTRGVACALLSGYLYHQGRDAPSKSGRHFSAALSVGLLAFGVPHILYGLWPHHFESIGRRFPRLLDYVPLRHLDDRVQDESDR
jgi:hypothetical protein